ncbi:MAG: IS1380 family transposase [Clostridiales bacterium]|nr:IS1380 family transposase [Clostridiales bacterium]
MPFYLRADSGFTTPGLYKISEEHEINYVIRLKANAKLYKLAKSLENELVQKCKVNMHKHQSIFGEFSYKAGSWDKERRVIVKIEKPKGQLTFKYTFIVTNIKEWNSEKIFKFYCQRGTMENFIKEAKHGFAIDKMSSTDFWTNANKLQQMLLAYNLNNWMRWLCFPEINLSNRISTIRTKIIKIAGKIVKTGRYIYFKLANYLENLTEEQLEEINEKHSGNLLKKVLQIEIPDYDKD